MWKIWRIKDVGLIIVNLVPALQHDVVERGWAVLWAGHAVAVLHLVQHLRVRHPWGEGVSRGRSEGRGRGQEQREHNKGAGAEGT